MDHVGLGLDFVKDDGPLYPEDEIFGVGENRLIPGFENEDDLPNITECLAEARFRETRRSSRCWAAIFFAC